tara:strand:- start:1113 stop:3596 length:2484 start_codon:yes stop_codon:yes gene_type:complete
MAHGNYTVTQHTTPYQAVGTAANGPFYLKIIPEPGYIVKKENFNISGDAPDNATYSYITQDGDEIVYENGVNNCVLPTGIDAVGFMDVDNAPYDPSFIATVSNEVTVIIYMSPGFVIPSTQTDFEIDIDGYSESEVQYHHCIREYYSSDLCTPQFWPDNPGGNRSTPCQSFFTEYALDIYDPTQVQGSLPVPSAPSILNSGWSTPNNDMFNQGAFSWQLAGLVTANANEVIIKRVFWTGVGHHFLNSPTYQFSTTAAAANYTVLQTTNVNITTTTSDSVSGSTKIPISDPAGIIPGMIIGGGSILSQASSTTFPYSGNDVRVVSYPYEDSGRIYIDISDEQNLGSGEQLTFQTNDDQNRVTTKEFTVVYNPINFIGCPNGHFQPGAHEIHYSNTTAVPSDIIHGSSVTGPVPLPVANPIINNVTFGSFGGGNTIPNTGGLQRLNVSGNAGATYRAQITNNAGNTYNFETSQFTTTSTNSGNLQIPSNGLASFEFSVPAISTDEEYSVQITPVGSTSLGANVPSALETFKLTQLAGKTITFDTTGTGLSIAATLDTTFKSSANKVEYQSRPFTIKGAITASDGDILYVTRQPEIDADDDGDFTNSRYLEKRVVSITDNAVTLDNVTNISANFVAWGENINETITVSAISGNIVTLSKKQENIKPNQIISFSKGGHHIEIGSATIEGMGTTSLTATIEGVIKRFGSENTTITFPLDNFVTDDPNSYNGEVNCSIGDGNVVDIDLTAFDPDINVGDKTYSLVSGEGPAKGSLSGFGGTGSAFDNNKVRYTHTGADTNAGTTDTFSYKSTVSSDAGDAAAEYGTITINIIE